MRYEMAELGQDRDRHANVFTVPLPPRANASMPRVATVNERVQRAGVRNGGQWCGSDQSSSSTRSDVSAWPLAKRPAMLGNRRRLWPTAIYAVTASRTIAAKLLPSERAYC